MNKIKILKQLESLSDNDLTNLLQITKPEVKYRENRMRSLCGSILLVGMAEKAISLGARYLGHHDFADFIDQSEIAAKYMFSSFSLILPYFAYSRTGKRAEQDSIFYSAKELLRKRQENN